MASFPTTGDDLIEGTSLRETFRALAGNDRVYGFGGDDFLYGNLGNDRLYGGNGHDTLYGGTGNDFLSGGGGLDSLYGGAGNDRLLGGAYSDYMFGGGGADLFMFNQSDVDFQDAWGNMILDFSLAQGDRIDLTAIDAIAGSETTNDAFTFIGSNAFSQTAGEARVAFAGGHTFVELDVDGDGQWDLSIDLTGTHSLTASDFLL